MVAGRKDWIRVYVKCGENIEPNTCTTTMASLCYWRRSQGAPRTTSFFHSDGHGKKKVQKLNTVFFRLMYRNCNAIVRQTRLTDMYVQAAATLVQSRACLSCHYCSCQSLWIPFSVLPPPRLYGGGDGRHSQIKRERGEGDDHNLVWNKGAFIKKHSHCRQKNAW